MFEDNKNTDNVCCANCKWFESRNQFCRKFPPTPYPVFIKGIGTVTNSAFPKISLSALDWCSFFEAIQKRQLI